MSILRNGHVALSVLGVMGRQNLRPAEKMIQAFLGLAFISLLVLDPCLECLESTSIDLTEWERTEDRLGRACTPSNKNEFKKK